MESVQDKVVLLQRVTGPMGDAYQWQYPPAAVQELTEKGRPFSDTVWLIHLPMRDERLQGYGGEDVQPGVFALTWMNSNAAPWKKFKGSLPRFSRDFLLALTEAWGENAQADNWDSFTDTSDSLLEEPADHLHIADQLMRLWVDELLAGRLDPYDGYMGQEDPADYFQGLISRAASDPDAHLRNRVPLPPAPPSLFGGES